jgi:hypothetical protein
LLLHFFIIPYEKSLDIKPKARLVGSNANPPISLFCFPGFWVASTDGKCEPTLPNLLIFHRIIKRFEEKLKGSPTDYLDSISFNDFPAAFFHIAGPLTLYPVTKSAAADELEKRISSVVVKSLTFPELKCFFRSAIAPLLSDFSDTFSFTTDPARRTN